MTAPQRLYGLQPTPQRLSVPGRLLLIASWTLALAIILLVGVIILAFSAWVVFAVFRMVTA